MINRIRQTATYIPKRRPACRHYDTCLNRAAEADLYDIGCGNCGRYQPGPRPHIQAMLDASGCRALVWWVFYGGDGDIMEGLPDHLRDRAFRRSDRLLLDDPAG
ncbi:MAG: hypothetical protein ACOWWM_12640 [Desulfobacterales bacterium]